MAKSDTESKVTKIAASSTKKVKKPSRTPEKSTKTSKDSSKATKTGRRNPIAAFFGYFKGAWKELRQVHWPTRRATWSLTGAVLAFSAFFVAFILLLDALFKYIFEIILK